MSCTIKEIAIKCNVSEGTVDRALNNRPDISEKTKNRILQVAKELNYEPNHLARCLAKGSTMTIGVVCTSITNNFFALLIEEIEKNVSQNGYFISLVISHNDMNKELEGIRYMAKRKVDGLIIFPIGQGDKYERELKELNVPIVTIYNRISPDFTHVDVDCRLIMQTAVSQLVHRGYEKIIYMDLGFFKLVDRGINTFSLAQRRKGYIKGIAEFGIQEDIYEKFDREELITKLKEYIKKKTKAAILCPCDCIAIKVLNLCRSNGIRIPEDVGIMGFDNIDMLENITPRINSVDCGARNMGKIAVDILLDKIKNSYSAGDVVADYSFTEGDTL